MHNNESTTSADGSTPGERDRRELQSVLAQMHGSMSDVIDNSAKWCDDSILRDPFPAAYAEASVAFGRVNAALNSGAYDDKLASVGLAGPSFEPKKRGLWKCIKDLFKRHGNALQYAKAAVSAARWGQTIVGSLTTLIPGGEVIKELYEVIENSAEDYIASKEAKGNDNE